MDSAVGGSGDSPKNLSNNYECRESSDNEEKRENGNDKEEETNNVAVKDSASEIEEKTPSSSDNLISTRRSEMLSKFSDPKLDPTWLFDTLRREINRETSYNLENDAKIRAVTQGTVNYEQFRQMVLGAHLHPLERKDKIEGCQNGKRPYVVWNTATPPPRATRKNEEDTDKNGQYQSQSGCIDDNDDDKAGTDKDGKNAV